MGKREMRQIARLYVAELLANDDMPDWPYDRGYIKPGDDGESEFTEEVRRIAERVRKTISRSALLRANGERSNGK